MKLSPRVFFFLIMSKRGDTNVYVILMQPHFLGFKIFLNENNVLEYTLSLELTEGSFNLPPENNEMKFLMSLRTSLP